MSIAFSLSDLEDNLSLFFHDEKLFISKFPYYIVKAFSSIGILIDCRLFYITKEASYIALHYSDENVKFQQAFFPWSSRFFSLEFYNYAFLHKKFKSCPDSLSPFCSVNTLQFTFHENSDFSLDSYHFEQSENYDIDNDYIGVVIINKFDREGNRTGFIKFIESDNRPNAKYNNYRVFYNSNDISYDELVFILEWELISLSFCSVQALVPDVLEDYVMDYSAPNTMSRFALAEMTIS